MTVVTAAAHLVISSQYLACWGAFDITNIAGIGMETCVRAHSSAIEFFDLGDHCFYRAVERLLG
jgi:hypothetical protein